MTPLSHSPWGKYWDPIPGFQALDSKANVSFLHQNNPRTGVGYTPALLISDQNVGLWHLN